MTSGQIFLERSRYFLGTEYRTQIRLSVDALPEDGLWWRANDQANSAGNLLLHQLLRERRRPGDSGVDAEDPRVKLRNFAGAIGTALLLALPLVVPTISRIDTWKIVLGIAGLIVFVSAGMNKG